MCIRVKESNRSEIAKITQPRFRSGAEAIGLQSIWQQGVKESRERDR